MGKGSNTTTTNQTQSYTPSPYATSAIQGAIGTAQGAASLPFNIPQAPVAGFTPQQLQAFNQVGNNSQLAMPFINQGANYFNQSAQGPNVSQFFNPFAGAVGNQLQNIFGMQNTQNTANLTQAAGGVGADRIAIGQGNLANQQGLAAGQTLANLYAPSLGAATQEQSILQGAGFGLGALGPAAQNAQLTGAQALLGTGGLQQQELQAMLNSPYQWNLAQSAFPYQQSNFLTGAVGALAPGLGGTTTGQGTTTGPTPSLLSQILGGGMGIAGTLGMTGAFGSGGWMAPMLAGLKRGGAVGYDEGGGTAGPDMSELAYMQPTQGGMGAANPNPYMLLNEEGELRGDAIPHNAISASMPSNAVASSAPVNIAPSSIVQTGNFPGIRAPQPQLNLSGGQGGSGGGSGLPSLSDMSSMMKLFPSSGGSGSSIDTSGAGAGFPREGSADAIAAEDMWSARGGRINHPYHFDDGGDVPDDMPPLHQEFLARHGIDTAPRDLSPTVTKPQLQAYGASAADPFGIPSDIASHVAPEFGAKWKGIEAAEPEASSVGSMIAPGLGVEGMLGKALSGGMRAAKAFPKLSAGAAGLSMVPAASARAGDPLAELGEKPTYTDEETARIKELQGKIDEQEALKTNRPDDIKKELAKYDATDTSLTNQKTAAMKKVEGSPLSIKKDTASTWDTKLETNKQAKKDYLASVDAALDKKSEPYRSEINSLADQLKKTQGEWVDRVNKAKAAQRPLSVNYPLPLNAARAGMFGMGVPMGTFMGRYGIPAKKIMMGSGALGLAPNVYAGISDIVTGGEARDEEIKNLKDPYYYGAVLGEGGVDAAMGYGFSHLGHAMANRAAERRALATEARQMEHYGPPPPSHMAGQSAAPSPSPFTSPSMPPSTPTPSAPPAPQPTGRTGVTFEHPTEGTHFQKRDKNGRLFWHNSRNQSVPTPDGFSMGGSVSPFARGGRAGYDDGGDVDDPYSNYNKGLRAPEVDARDVSIQYDPHAPHDTGAPAPNTDIRPGTKVGESGLPASRTFIDPRGPYGAPPSNDPNWMDQESYAQHNQPIQVADHPVAAIPGGIPPRQAPESPYSPPPAPVAARSGPGKDTSSQWASSPWAALAAAGFGMMSGTSPFPGVNIGRGAMAGLQVLQGQRASAQKDTTIEQESRKLDLEEKREKFQESRPYPSGSKIDPNTGYPIPEYQRYDPIKGWIPALSSDEGSVPAQSAQTAGPTKEEVAKMDHPNGANQSVLVGNPHASLIRAIDEGRENLQSVPMRIRGKVEKDLNDYDGTYDQVNWAARNRQQSDLASNGKDGQVILGVNQLLPHLATASRDAAALDNSDYPAENTIANWWATQTGDPRVVRFNSVRQIAATDAARIMRGSGTMSLTEIEDWKRQLSEAGSPRQLQQVISQLADDLIGARISSIQSGYRTVMHKEPPDFVSPEAKAAREEIIKRSAATEEAAKPKATSAAKPKPTDSDRAYVKAHPEKRDQFISHFGVEP